jgi:hypothetical protein
VGKREEKQKETTKQRKETSRHHPNPPRRSDTKKTKRRKEEATCPAQAQQRVSRKAATNALASTLTRRDAKDQHQTQTRSVGVAGTAKKQDVNSNEGNRPDIARRTC